MATIRDFPGIPLAGQVFNGETLELINCPGAYIVNCLVQKNKVVGIKLTNSPGVQIIATTFLENNLDICHDKVSKPAIIGCIPPTPTMGPCP